MTKPVSSSAQGGVIVAYNEATDSSSESDYMPGDDSASDASDYDEEVVQIDKRFKEFYKKMRRRKCAPLDDVVFEGFNCRAANKKMKSRKCAQVDDVVSEGLNCSAASDGEDEEEDDTPNADITDHDLLDLNIDVRVSKYPRFDAKSAVPKFELGMIFSGKKQFREAVIKHGLVEKRAINFVKNEPKRVRAVCDWEGCPWVCLLSINSKTDSWQIATYVDQHFCPPRRDNKLVTGSRIAEKYAKFILSNPSWSIAHMRETVQKGMSANVSIPKLKRAKALVLDKALDATIGQYQRLYDYQLELLRSNPGSTVIVDKEADVEPPMFKRMYICLDACKKGFIAGCRKVVGLDGCFIKGAANGELLCALGRDANNQMYPIAWAVVDKETNDSWDWFCDLLCRDLGVGDGKEWVFISDKQRGLLNAVVKWAPEAEHRKCARLIYANWKIHFKNKEYHKKFWKCAKAPCIMLFNLTRENLAKETREGARTILNNHPQHWSRAWFRLGSNCDSVDNKICESFNKWIIEARFFPIITMLETIRRKVMLRIQEQRSQSEKWTTLICPNILKKMNVYITESGFCHAIWKGADQYEVSHHSNRFIVNLDKKECSCRYWQLSGLPCPHAISCTVLTNKSLDNFIANCYSVEQFKQTYSHCLLPVKGMNSWPVSDKEPLKAPGYVRMPGYVWMPVTRRTKRRREPSEGPEATKMSRVGTTIRCSMCHQAGHNRSTCEKINGVLGPSSATSGSQIVGTPNDLVLSNAQQSSTNTKKRSTTQSLHAIQATNESQKMVKSSAKAKVCSTEAKAAPKRAMPSPVLCLLMPPWESDKL